VNQNDGSDGGRGVMDNGAMMENCWCEQAKTDRGSPVKGEWLVVR